MSLKERARKLKRDIPAVIMAMEDEETPARAKVLAVITVVYALSPIDLIPDFIPVLGLLDDVIILPALVALTVKLIPRDVWDRCLEEADNMSKIHRSKKWYYALPVVLIWLLVVWIVIKTIWL